MRLKSCNLFGTFVTVASIWTNEQQFYWVCRSGCGISVYTGCFRGNWRTSGERSLG